MKNAEATISSRRGGWVVKSLRTGGLKILGLGGYQFGEGLLLIGGGGQYPITCHDFFSNKS